LRGEKLPEVASVKSLDDIWKCPADPLLNQLFAHWTLFRSLVFGQSLVDVADENGCVKTSLWSSGLDGSNRTINQRLELLGDWQAFIVPPASESFIVVSLADLLLSVVAWLSDDSELGGAINQPDSMLETAREITGKRAPSEREVAKVRKLVEAFSLGLDGHVGDRPALESWSYLNGAERDFTKVRHQLAPIRKRFERTAAWHRQAIAASMVPQPIHYDGTVTEFDQAGYRSSLDRAISNSVLHARQLAAIAISEAVHAQESSQLAAVIGNQLILTSSAKGAVKQQLVTKLRDTVTQALVAAFPGMAPKVNVTVAETL
jgi:hypothetical protein